MLEFVENEVMYTKLVSNPRNITALAYQACDLKNPSQAYALNILTAIMKEFPEHE